MDQFVSELRSKISEAKARNIAQDLVGERIDDWEAFRAIDVLLDPSIRIETLGNVLSRLPADLVKRWAGEHRLATANKAAAVAALLQHFSTQRGHDDASRSMTSQQVEHLISAALSRQAAFHQTPSINVNVNTTNSNGTPSTPAAKSSDSGGTLLGGVAAIIVALSGAGFFVAHNSGKDSPDDDSASQVETPRATTKVAVVRALPAFSAGLWPTSSGTEPKEPPTVPDGTAVVILRKSSERSLVRLPSGKTGWVKNGFLSAN